MSLSSPSSSMSSASCASLVSWFTGLVGLLPLGGGSGSGGGGGSGGGCKLQLPAAANFLEAVCSCSTDSAGLGTALSRVASLCTGANEPACPASRGGGVPSAGRKKLLSGRGACDKDRGENGGGDDNSDGQEGLEPFLHFYEQCRVNFDHGELNFRRRIGGFGCAPQWHCIEEELPCSLLNLSYLSLSLPTQAVSR